jgi:hypothetical protein
MTSKSYVLRNQLDTLEPRQATLPPRQSKYPPTERIHGFDGSVRRALREVTPSNGDANGRLSFVQ